MGASVSTLELPKSSKATVAAAIALLCVAFYLVSRRADATIWTAVLAFFISGFLADLFTALAHFGFDYVFPYDMPILGPVAREFREHHDCPTLDPSDYVVNFSKGAYCSVPVSSLVCVASLMTDERTLPFLVLATLLGMSTWAFFFHQIHSYAHMGSTLQPEDFKERVAAISRLSNQAEQIAEFDKLFATVPIPPWIRVLQRCRLILNPRTHNLHHIFFLSDFSSVNGWSDPLINLVLRPLARRMKMRQETAQP